MSSCRLVRRMKRTPVRCGMAGNSCMAAHVGTYHFIQRRKSFKRLWSSKHSYRHLACERCTVGKVLTVVPYFRGGQPLDERLGHNEEKGSFLRNRIQDHLIAFVESQHIKSSEGDSTAMFGSR